MCGIIGCIAHRNVGGILLEGLKRMEYRGYDSAGLALVSLSSAKKPQLQLYKECGKVSYLAATVHAAKPRGNIGVAHTRWATHGAVTKANAHPHVAKNRLAVVHNGIVENYLSIREELKHKGFRFIGDTDSEVIAQLLLYYCEQGDDLAAAIFKTVRKLTGAYALAIIDARQPHVLVAVRKGSPLVIGIGDEENFVASDPLALLQVTDRFIYMEDEEIAFIHRNDVTLHDFRGKPRKSKAETQSHAYTGAERGEYSHYMLKEIYDQPQAVEQTLHGRISGDHFLPESLGHDQQELLRGVRNLYITGCGTSYHSALIARYLFEEYAEMGVQTEVASEFRYMKKQVPPACLYITISQSGETADILAALKNVKSGVRRKTTQSGGQEGSFLATLGICNVPSSTLVRNCDLPLIINAGPEIGVASTKAFTAQLTGLLVLLGFFWHLHGRTAEEKKLVRALRRLPPLMHKVLGLRPQIRKMAQQLTDSRSSLFIGRNILYPLALEGALKLKEISYIHSEAYPGGELKHGPLALIDRDFPTIALIGKGTLRDKIKSNMQEIAARRGRLFVFTDQADAELRTLATSMVELPKADPLIAPLLFAIPLQLLAYEVAILLGTDVDQPRNLAKSVTVE